MNLKISHSVLVLQMLKFTYVRFDPVLTLI